MRFGKIGVSLRCKKVGRPSPFMILAPQYNATAQHNFFKITLFLLGTIQPAFLHYFPLIVLPSTIIMQELQNDYQ